MNFGSKRPDDLDINVVSLIDVLLMLLIFLMLTTTFDRNSELRIRLPEASRKSVESVDQTVEVDIDQHGRVYVNARALVNSQATTIRNAIDEAVDALGLGGGEREPTIVINADKQTAYQAVIRVMDAARQLGLQRVTFVTRIEASE